ncbi:MAG: alpha-2-macroglobulin family protein [Saprospiraceae bacterium]
MNHDYENLWKQVQKLEEDGLPKSALSLVDSIYSFSRLDKNRVQQIKSLIHRAKYTASLDEQGVVKSINLLETELKSSDDNIVRSVLHSVLAELFSNYFNMNLWEIKDRTAIVGVEAGDIGNWSASDFLKTIRMHYLASIKEPSLKVASVQDYQTILTEGKKSDLLRPSLFDILAHRALDYFENSRADLDFPDLDISIDDPILFSHTDQFLKFKLNEADSASLFYSLIQLFKSLESFHQKDSDPSAWIDVVRKRLQYIYSQFTGEKKDELYEAALDQWINVLGPKSQAAGFFLNKAQLYSTQGRKYQPDSKDSVYKMHLVKAATVLRLIMKNYPGTEEALQAENLLTELTQPSLQGQAERVNSIGNPFRLLVEYQNANKVFIRIIPVSLNLRQEIYGIPEGQWINKLLAENSVKTMEQNLPGTEDLQHHSVEIKIDALPAGMYAVLLSSNLQMRNGEDLISLLYTHVSNLAYFHSFNQYYDAKINTTSKNDLIVVQRETGAPLSNVKVSFYENQYQPSLQRNQWIFQTSSNTNSDGKVHIDLPKNKNYSVKIEKENDYLWLDDAFSNASYYNQNQKDVEDVLFFLDRSIYRPGQTIYFKGLALLREDNGKVQIIKNKKLEVILNDANGKEVSRKNFVSNDFGSFNGSFTAPVAGLSGSMTLISSLNQSGVSFNVEEYKRPKFEVKFDTAKIVANLNESVSISGYAKNLAGNAVDGANLKYKVSRQRWIRPMPWWHWKSYYPYPSNPKIISQGKLMTDRAGKFVIPFTALAEPGTDLKNEDASFIYTIDVDITDFTGETRSESTSLRIGNKNLILSSSLNQYENKDSLKSFTLSGTDLNGQSLLVNGNFKISKLSEPDKIPRSRYWNKPDQFIYDEKSYHTWFPLDIYNDEDLVTTWPVSSIVLNGNFDSGKPVVFSSVLATGIYKLEALAKDSHQAEVKYEQFFWVEAPLQSQFASIKSLAVYQNKSALEPGESLQYILKSKGSPQYILQTSSGNAESQWIISKESINNSIKLSETDRGEMNQFHWIMVNNNRVYTESIQYGILWTNKELTIETVSFRDKLLPGQDEEWKLKISGKGNEKLVAELVASMYDQSLDALYPHAWNYDLFRLNYLAALSYTSVGFMANGSNVISFKNIPYKEIESIQYRNLNWFGFEMYNRYYDARGGKMMKSMRPQADAMMNKESAQAVPNPPSSKMDTKDEEKATAKDGSSPVSPPIQPRKNLNETVFFFPEIKSDADGNFILKFKMNEALTRWRLMLFGHTQDLKSGYLEKEVITQKELMVFPNSPRFVRMGDILEFPAKVSNLSEKSISGKARIELFDPLSGASLDNIFNLKAVQSNFTIPPGESSPLSWNLKIPTDYSGMLGYRVIAEAGSMSDGEENVIPVLSNRMLITESYPFQVRAKQEKTFDFASMVTKMNSTSLKNHQYTLECTSNPVWYAIQSLPYMMEYPFECTEQLVNRYYANALAAKVVESNPKIKAIFDEWNRKGDLKSPLQKNQELKSAVLEETPWVKDALKEEDQQKMIALLFDINKLASEKDHIIQVLRDRQLSNGGFPWFGGRDDWYITQYVVESLGHLKKLGIDDPGLNEILQKAILYCDNEVVRYFNEMKKVSKKDSIGLPDIAIHYLYARSFYMENEIKDKSAFVYFIGETEKQWLKQNLYNQGLIALLLHRWRPASVIPSKIMASLNEKAQHSEELGMYWKFDAGYRFFELPIETQALLIETYAETKSDPNVINEMRLWLLKNKQTNHWPSTKATAAAIYALMLNGNDWAQSSIIPTITLAGEKLIVAPDQTIAGIGYFKIKKDKSEINSKLSHLTVQNPNNHVLWGAVYWQYFEDLNKVSASESKPFTIQKKMFVESTEGNKTTLKPFTTLAVGDKLIIRLEIKIDRPMEYIHLKDLRAAGLEPIDVISQYKYQGGLGYYESTKDLSTNFFFDHITTGTYVLEYPVRVSQRGVFSNGISTMQCMYAPEFNGHTNGEVITIK